MGCGCNKNRGTLPTRVANPGPTKNIVHSNRNTNVETAKSPDKIWLEKVAAEKQAAVEAQKLHSAKNLPQNIVKNESNEDKFKNINLNIKSNNTIGMSKERLEIEKRRREAIKNALGKK